MTVKFGNVLTYVSDGTTNESTAINALITSIDSDDTKIFFPRGTYQLGASVTFPTNIEVEMDKGAIFSDGGTASIVLTINGKLNAGLYQVFDFTGAGSGVTFTNGGEGWLNWWCDGGVGTAADPWTSSFDSANGLQDAHDAGLTVIKGTAGYYASTTEADWTSGSIVLKGEGRRVTNFVINGAMTYWLDVDDQNFTFEDFTLFGSLAHITSLRHRQNVVTAGINLEKFDLSTISRVNFEGVLGSAIRFHRAIRSNFTDIEVAYCGDTNKPAWHFDTGTSVDNHVIQGAYFDGIGLESNYNAAVWLSESSGGNFEGSIANTYDGLRFENAAWAMAEITVNTGTATVEAITIDGSIGATVTAVTDDAFDVVLQIESAASWGFGVGSTIVGASFTATIDRIDHQTFPLIDINDRGRHRFANIHLNRAGNLSSGYAAEVNFTYYSTWVNVRVSGNSQADGALHFLNSAYTTVTNLVGVGSTAGNTEVRRLLKIEDSPGMIVQGVVMRYWGGLVVDGAIPATSTSDECLVENVVVEAAGDLPGEGIIELADAGIVRTKLVDCHITGSTTTGDGFRTLGASNYCQGCIVSSSTVNYAFNLGGLGAKAANCQIANVTGDGFYTVYDNVSIRDCDVEELTGTAVEIGAGADSVRITGNRFVGYSSAGAGYGVYVNGASRSFGIHILNNWFDAEGHTTVNDLYLVNGFANAQIAFNNFENASAQGVFIGSGANKQIYGNVGAFENKPVVTPDSVSTSGTGEDDLITYTIPRYHHDVFDRIRIRAAGVISGSNDTKTIKFHFGSSSFDLHPANNNTNDWLFEADIAMKNDSDHRCRWTGISGASIVGAGYEAFNDNLDTGSIIIKITGNCANVSDIITQTMFIVEFI